MENITVSELVESIQDITHKKTVTNESLKPFFGTVTVSIKRGKPDIIRFEQTLKCPD